MSRPEQFASGCMFVTQLWRLIGFPQEHVSCPQDSLKLKHYYIFLGNVQIHDNLNATLTHPATGELQQHRTRVRKLTTGGLVVDVDGQESQIAVSFEEVTQRLHFLRSLYTYTTIAFFRRRDGGKHEHNEVLKLSRHFVTDILELLTLSGSESDYFVKMNVTFLNFYIPIQSAYLHTAIYSPGGHESLRYQSFWASFYGTLAMS